MTAQPGYHFFYGLTPSSAHRYQRRWERVGWLRWRRVKRCAACGCEWCLKANSDESRMDR